MSEHTEHIENPEHTEQIPAAAKAGDVEGIAGHAGADLERVAVTALTEIGRRAQPDEHGHRHGPDAAEVICTVVAAAAANLGGVEVLLAGRPGSWEADRVRGMVASTAGVDDDGLWRFRTEPVRLVLDVEAEFDRFGLTGLFLDDYDEVSAVYSAGELDEDTERATDRLLEVLDRLFDDDLRAYRAGYAQVVAVELARLDRPDLPVEVVPPQTLGARPDWAPLLEGLHLLAAERAPLPATGQPPDWTSGDPADAVRAAGYRFVDRARTLLASGGAS